MTEAEFHEKIDQLVGEWVTAVNASSLSDVTKKTYRTQIRRFVRWTRDDYEFPGRGTYAPKS